MRTRTSTRAARAAAAPARLVRAARAVALLLLCALPPAACGEDAEPATGDGAPLEVPDFDAAAAFELLRQQVAFGPRVPGTQGHAAQLEWMTEYLRERADTLVAQPFTHVTAAGDTLRLTNLFARFRPDERERVLLLAHWDTRSVADRDPEPARRDQPIPGANDGASGTAVLLQLADMFAGRPPPLGVDLLLVDGEDYAPGEMLLGARHFAANQPDGYPPLYGVLVDMVADDDPVYPVEPFSWQYAPEVVQRVWSVARRIGYGDTFVERPGPAITDDHIPLNEAGIRTINIIDFDYGPANAHWHTHQDDMGAVSARGLEAVGTVVGALVYSGG